MTARIEVVLTRGAARVFRAGVLGTCASVLAVLAHGAAGGCVEAPGVLLTVAGVAAAAWALAGQRRSLWTVLSWLLAVQVAGHLILTALCSDQEPDHLARSMVVAHLAAVVLTAAVLHSGDAALWSAPRLPAGWPQLVRQGAPLLIPALPAASRNREARTTRTGARWQARPPARRGPPRPALPAGDMAA